MSADADFPGMGGADTPHLCWRMGPDTQPFSVEIFEEEDTRDWATAARHETAAPDMATCLNVDDRPWPPGGPIILRPEDVPGWEVTPAGDGPEDRGEPASDEEGKRA